MPRAVAYLGGGLFGLVVGSILSSNAVFAFVQTKSLFGPSNCASSASRVSPDRGRQPATPVLGFARPRGAPVAPAPTPGPRLSIDETRFSGVTGGTIGLDWRRADLVDIDDDGVADILRVELASGDVRTWRIIRR